MVFDNGSARRRDRAWRSLSWWCQRLLCDDCHAPLACPCVCHVAANAQLLDELAEYIRTRYTGDTDISSWRTADVVNIRFSPSRHEPHNASCDQDQ
jgi:hypothetical protein